MIKLTEGSSKILVMITVQATSSTEDVLAQVNGALRKRAQLLQSSDTPQLQALADNMWKIRAEIVQFLVDRRAGS